jgi:hypothetical protein
MESEMPCRTTSGDDVTRSVRMDWTASSVQVSMSTKEVSAKSCDEGDDMAASAE